MPRGRKSAARTAPVAQSTLSFNNRVTKSGTQLQRDEQTASAKKLAHLEETINQEETEIAEVKPSPKSTQVKPETEDEEGEDTIVEEEPEPSKAGARRKVRTVKGKDDRELAAEKVTDPQLKKYWQKEENARLAPRVHQQSLPLHEKILRHFDLSSQYGPCIGIPRLARWRRANTLGLQPPIEVLAVLLREEEGGAKEGVKYAVGKGTGRSQGCGKMAYIDELGGGRVVLVE